MNQIHLQVVDKNINNNYHVKLFIDQKESGIFYLNEDQYFFFRKALQHQSTHDDVQFNVSDPYSDEEDSEESLD